MESKGVVIGLGIISPPGETADSGPIWRERALSVKITGQNAGLRRLQEQRKSHAVV
jgi:hypothetical protein